MAEMNLDPKTAFLTAVVVPALIVVLGKLGAFVRSRTGDIVEGVLWHIALPFDRRMAARISFRQHARNQLSASWSSYLLVPRVGHPLSLKTDDVFVPLTIESNLGSGQRYNAGNVLEAGKRLLVIGDPGSGKTTLMKRLLREALKAARRSSDAQLPVIVELKNVASQLARDPDSLMRTLRSQVVESRGVGMGRLFDIYSEGAGLLVLLDGLDEVSSDNYPLVSAAINDLARKLEKKSPTSRIVLTMRRGFFSQVRTDFVTTFPITLAIQPLTPSEFFEFLTKWPFEEGDTESPTRIYGELIDSPALRDLCANPLILAMFVASRQSSGDLTPPLAPDTRTRFYLKVLEELLAERRQELLKSGTVGALLEQRFNVFGELAAQNLINFDRPANVLLWSDAVARVAKVTHCSSATAETRLLELIRDTGILVGGQPRETLHFIHLTFCEFLAAHYVTGLGGEEVGRLVNKHALGLAGRPQGRTRLSEVVVFASGLILPRDRTAALNVIASLSDGSLLASCVLECKQYDDLVYIFWRSNEWAELSSSSQEEWDADWLQRVQLLSRLLRDEEDIHAALGLPTEYGATEFLADLVKEDRDRLIQLFGLYATTNSIAAFRLAEYLSIDLALTAPEVVVTACQTPDSLAMAVRCARQPSRPLVAWACVLAEAGLRYAPVAKGLTDEPRSDHLTTAVASLPRRERWGRDMIFRHSPTFYTDCISLARTEIRRTSAAAPSFPFLAELRRVRASAAVIPSILFFLPMLIVTLTLVFFLIVVIVDVASGTWSLDAATSAGSQDSGAGTSTTPFVLVLVGYAWLISGLFPVLRSEQYDKLCNLKSTSDKGRASLLQRVDSVLGWLAGLFMPRVSNAASKLERMRGHVNLSD